MVRTARPRLPKGGPWEERCGAVALAQPGCKTVLADGFRHSLFIGWLLLMGLITGCAGSGKPASRAATPAAVVEAERWARQAARLQAEENWSGAAVYWQRAADQFQLLNRLPPLAIAWHNGGVCHWSLGEIDIARSLLGQAEQLNLELGQGAEWWRNQLVLLQLDEVTLPDGGETRLVRLLARPDPPPDARLSAVLAHEIARIRARRGQLDEALEWVGRARAQFESVGDAAGVAATQVTEAQLLRRSGRWPACEAAWRDALNWHQANGVQRGIAVCLAGLGAALAAQDRASPEAAGLLQRGWENLHRLGMGEAAEQARSDWEALKAGTAIQP